MNTLSNVDYNSYSDDELEQAIKNIQKVKANRKSSRSNQQKISIRLLTNQENESLSKDQNMLKTYIIGYLYGKPPYSNGEVARWENGSAYNLQNNGGNKCSLGYNFKTLIPINNCDKNRKNYIRRHDAGETDIGTIDSLVSFSYNEI